MKFSRFPHTEWRYVELGLRAGRPRRRGCRLRVRTGPPQVRLALVRRAEMERLRRDQSARRDGRNAPGPSGEIHLRHRTSDEVRHRGDIARAANRPACTLRHLARFRGARGPR